MNFVKQKRPIVTEFSFDYLWNAVTNENKYVDNVIGETIYELMFYLLECEEGRGIIRWIKEKLSEKQIDLVIEEIIKFIKNEFFHYDIEIRAIYMFEICCELDLEKTKNIFNLPINKDKKYSYEYHLNIVYDRILIRYELKKELERYKDKYKLLKNHLKYMPDGEGYLQTKVHFEEIKCKSILNK